LEPGGEVSIRTVRLTKHYRSGENTLVVFDNLDLEIAPGERIALVGESGAGKSSLLHLLGGLDKPTNGTIYFGDREISSLDESARADFRNREIGFVWQTHYLLPEFTALENVMMPLLIRGFPQSKAAPIAKERLGEVGLAGRINHRAGELSGGEQQRVVLARALVGRPRVLLADEPTGNLDYKTGDKIADLFDELHHLYKLTSVYVTHNLEFARRCDRVLKLEHGVLVSLQGGGVSENTASREDGTNYV
jgi:lipoprotein-releasing system ATP-binding protein